MAAMEQGQFSLMTLEDELSCSICLSPFDCPVTIPCGHNFCQDCLLVTWKDSNYSCPQCRTVFATKPELKKNTVLSSVVETFDLGQSKSEARLVVEERKAEKQDVIRCDTCLDAEAFQTCLTCMASFCEEHLRPHRENPTFRLHQLSEPVGDLSERICPDHHKLLEFFCSQHDQAICSFCLQQLHKGCSFISPEEQRNLKESDLREKVDVLDGKINRTESVILQINDLQSKLEDTSAKRKTACAAMYQQMRDMLAQEEREAQHEMDHELKTVQAKLWDLVKRFTENTDNMRKARDDINSLLSQSQSLAFLQVSFDLPKIAKFDPHTPRINLDSKKTMATQALAAALKEFFKQPVEAKLQILKPDDKAVPVSESTEPKPRSDKPDPPEQKKQSTSQSPDCPPVQSFFQPVPVPVYIGPPHGDWYPPHLSAPGPHRAPPFMARQKPNRPQSESGHQSPHKQDKKPTSAPGGNKPSAGGSDFKKKENPKSHASAEKKTGSDFKKKENPKSHASAGKKTGAHPQPAKK